MSDLPEVPGCTVTADPYGMLVTCSATGDSEMVENAEEAAMAGGTLQILAQHRGDLGEAARAMPGFDVHHRQWAAVWRGRLADAQLEPLVPDATPAYHVTCWPTPDTGADGTLLWTVTLWAYSEEELGALCAQWLEKVAEATGGPA